MNGLGRVGGWLAKRHLPKSITKATCPELSPEDQRQLRELLSSTAMTMPEGRLREMCTITYTLYADALSTNKVNHLKPPSMRTSEKEKQSGIVKLREYAALHQLVEHAMNARNISKPPDIEHVAASTKEVMDFCDALNITWRGFQIVGVQIVGVVYLTFLVIADDANSVRYGRSSDRPYDEGEERRQYYRFD